ncbi:RagB/SusD family nutrient uptake outer membrane protein [Neolewinella lacunae]|uniref:RagB/SusD family nutrient uptake outer membrane protein n=1 Tax=Neolewinella lacunae TaxID=1517758 RepID=A0A923PKI2_9BACT|nr:RagB/SusD family nutrient uptake outer membrane protein [Neolewinella lacunae]MBC6995039.1 RagB/SusD family nutrient uptake outer membrane protein [Neolewinella lacunae]MDN3634034.1 RagB/SusD family nutrient uptake outer membrane protein [Neolewinella lacunae]
MKLFIKIAAICCISALFLTCSEEFLETAPQGTLNSQSLADENGINLALVSAYSRLDGWASDWGAVSNPWGMSGSNWIFGSVSTDDAYKGSEPTDFPTFTQIELYQWQPNQPDLNDKFLAVYDGIRRANETIALINENLDLADDVRDRLMGEAKFLRAHYHMEAWKFWKAVPFIEEDQTDFKEPNDQDIFPLIVADFVEAESKLPTSQADLGRATKGAANAMLGRLYMLNRDFTNAAAALNKVTGYSLNPCFHDMFSFDGENGPEMIFSIQASVGDGVPDVQNGNFSDRLAFPHAGSPFGCCGFHQPSQNLVNAYRTTEDGLPALDNSSDENPGVDEPVDPRIDWTIGRDGIDYLGHGEHNPTWIRDRSWAGEYSAKKFTYAPGEGNTVSWNPAHLNPINVPIIRYADVLLMQAEIDVENGNLEAARAKVNQIRERAGNCAQGVGATPVPLDDESTNANYVVSTYDTPWTDANAAREAVRLERRLELALEGHRWFDLVRYGTDYYKSTMNAYLDREQQRRQYMQAHNNVEDKHTRYPIPTQAILLSQIDGVPTLQQNPGY